MGRPSLYTPELATKICERIIAGDSVRKLCELEWAPEPSSIYLWLSKHVAFSEQYARALRQRAEKYAEEIVDISDCGTTDSQRDRLSVDARKWVVSKLLPRVYGEKIDLALSGEIAVTQKPGTVEDAKAFLAKAGLDL